MPILTSIANTSLEVGYNSVSLCFPKAQSVDSFQHLEIAVSEFLY